ncbi:WSC domain-containing protein [Cladochytrium replicatum]|nr:WSC domain-containing protein [Cladochytrium replicatum]
MSKSDNHPVVKLTTLQWIVISLIAQLHLGQAQTVWVFQGCYTDSREARLLNSALVVMPSSNSWQACAQACSAYAYFGVQYRQECWCGNSLNPAQSFGASGCGQLCTGNTQQTCGGSSPYASTLNMAQNAQLFQAETSERSFSRKSLPLCRRSRPLRRLLHPSSYRLQLLRVHRPQSLRHHRQWHPSNSQQLLLLRLHRPNNPRHLPTPLRSLVRLSDRVLQPINSTRLLRLQTTSGRGTGSHPWS